MKKNQGFTLIEVLVAAGVLGIVATALFGLLSTSLSNLQKVEQLHQYELAAADVMNKVLFLPTLPVPASAEGSIDNSYARWTVNIDQFEPDKLNNPGSPAVNVGTPALTSASQAVVKIHVVVTWPGKTTDRTIDLETLKAAKIENYDLASRIQTIFPPQ